MRDFQDGIGEANGKVRQFARSPLFLLRLHLISDSRQAILTPFVILSDRKRMLSPNLLLFLLDLLSLGFFIVLDDGQLSLRHQQSFYYKQSNQFDQSIIATVSQSLTNHNSTLLWADLDAIRDLCMHLRGRPTLGRLLMSSSRSSKFCLFRHQK